MSILNTLKSKGFFKYGVTIPNLVLHGKPAPYPVINERAARAGAGIMFLMGFYSFMQALYLSEYTYLKYTVLLFFIDFFIRVIVGTRFSPIAAIANFAVRKQEKEYVGVVQKRFAWSIGLLLSGIMVTRVWGLGLVGPINLMICLVCLTFMFLETSFGICVGCKIYNFLLRKGIIKMPEHKPTCPGNVCAVE